jgi:hypothetical protein
MATLVVSANIDGGLLSEATTSAGAERWHRDAHRRLGQRRAHTGGQIKFGTNDFGVYEPFYSFDTSPLGASASASAVVLATAFTAAGAGITGTLRCYLNSSWDEAISTGDFRTATQLGSQTNLATLASGSVTTGDTYINWTDVAFPANVNLTGHTLVVLSTNRIVAGTAPTVDETFLLSSSNKPKITITYTITGVTGRGARCNAGRDRVSHGGSHGSEATGRRARGGVRRDSDGSAPGFAATRAAPAGTSAVTAALTCRRRSLRPRGRVGRHRGASRSRAARGLDRRGHRSSPTSGSCPRSRCAASLAATSAVTAMGLRLTAVPLAAAIAAVSDDRGRASSRRRSPRSASRS